MPSARYRATISRSVSAESFDGFLVRDIAVPHVTHCSKPSFHRLVRDRTSSRPAPAVNVSSPIPRGSMAWVRVCRASLALLPQLPRQNKSSTGAHVHREPAQASPVLSPGFDSSIGHPLQLVEPFSKIRRLQCLDIGFYQLAKLASLSRGEIADRNCLQECRCCVGCVRGA